MTVVEISASDLAGATNIAPLVEAAMDGLGAGDMVTFKKQPGIDRYPWAGLIRPHAGVLLEGAPVTVTEATPTMIAPDGPGVTIDTLDILGNGHVSVACVRVADGIDDTTITRVELDNTGADVETNVVMIDDADNTTVQYCRTHRVKRLVWLRGDTNGTLVHHNTGTDFGASAFEMGATGTCHNTEVFSNQWHMHAADADAGHMIVATPPPTGLHTNLRIVSNEAFGLPGVPNMPGVSNGASGDLIAVRGVDGFAVVDNHVKDSGEIGMTVVKGSRNGVLAFNLVEGTDISAMAIGGFGIGDPTDNITITQNMLRDYGRDLEGRYTGRPDVTSGVLLGAGTRTVAHRMSIGTGNGYGMYAREGAHATIDRQSTFGGTAGRTYIEDGAELITV